jgi:hypothetical protein
MGEMVGEHKLLVGTVCRIAELVKMIDVDEHIDDID